MKQLMLGFSLSGVVIVFVFIFMTINGRMTRQNEIYSTLTNSVDSAIENVANSKNYTIDSKNEFVTEVLQNLLVACEDDSDYDIKLYSTDEEKGLITLKITQTYQNPNGGTGKNEVTKTVLLDTSGADMNEDYASLRFFDKDNNIITEINVKVGGTFIPIDSPTGKWTDGNVSWTKDELSKVIIVKDMNFTPCLN